MPGVIRRAEAKMAATKTESVSRCDLPQKYAARIRMSNRPLVKNSGPL